MIFFAFFALCAWTVFIGWYWLRARWWKSDIGWNVMGVAFGIWLLLALNTSSIVWPEYEYRPYVRATVYLFLGLLGAQRTIQMEREQRHHVQLVD